MSLLPSLNNFQLFLVFIVALLVGAGETRRSQPHIVFVVADDLGWNDVGWHNPDILTPQLDALSKNGVVLNQSYVLPVCSPSRTAFLTGYYPFRVGRQNDWIHPLEPVGVPVNVPFISEKLKALGYATHAVGKWHLGYCNESYTPTFRGFDTFLGFYLGDGNYFNHTSSAEILPISGYDFRNGTTPTTSFTGKYSTHVFGNTAIDIIRNHNADQPLFLYLAFQAVHAPLQVPQKYIDLYPNIKNKARQIFSGMVSALDEAVGQVVQALIDRDFWKDTFLVFTTDNGGETTFGGNNWPLRGNKHTIWEGGTRGAGFVYSEWFKRKGIVSNNLIHAVDWFPTFLEAAGVESFGDDVDGISQWDSLVSGGRGPRTEFVYNIFQGSEERAAIRVGDYKLIVGNAGIPDGWIPVPDSYQEDYVEPIYKTPKIQLFNLIDDPLEKHDLSSALPNVTSALLSRLRSQEARSVPADDPPSDPRGSPLNFGGFFSPGWCMAR